MKFHSSFKKLWCLKKGVELGILNLFVQRGLTNISNLKSAIEIRRNRATLGKTIQYYNTILYSNIPRICSEIQSHISIILTFVERTFGLWKPMETRFVV